MRSMSIARMELCRLPPTTVHTSKRPLPPVRCLMQSLPWAACKCPRTIRKQVDIHGTWCTGLTTAVRLKGMLLTMEG